MNRFTHCLATAVCLALVAAVPVVLPETVGAAPSSPAVVTAQAASAQTAALVYAAPKRTLRYGVTGSDVKALQQRLTALKYYSGAADGVFGSNTLEAVWAFQEVQHLTVDGVVGPITARALVSPRLPLPQRERLGPCDHPDRALPDHGVHAGLDHRPARPDVRLGVLHRDRIRDPR
jgi:putative peptidoglycan binding protein